MGITPLPEKGYIFKGFYPILLPTTGSIMKGTLGHSEAEYCIRSLTSTTLYIAMKYTYPI